MIYPGLVDLHSHLGYNTLPLWAEPTQTDPYLHRDIWPGEATYRTGIAWPAWTLIDAAPESLLAYIQVRRVQPFEEPFPALQRRPRHGRRTPGTVTSRAPRRSPACP